MLLRPAAVLAALLAAGLSLSPAALAGQTPPDSARPPAADTLRADTLRADTLRADNTAAVVGEVRLPDGTPLAGADVILQGTARRVRTGADGRFAFTGLAEGAVDLLVRKLGYDPVEGPLFVNAGRQYQLTLTLTLRSQLSTVLVTAQVFNEVYGVVLDTLNQPMAGAIVEIGGDRRVVTGRDGAFLFPDIAPGKWLIRVSKPGFVPRVVGLQMLAQVERNLTIRLSPPDGSTMISRSDETAWQEHGRRRAFTAGTGAALVTREELARFGDQPLDRVIDILAPTTAMALRAPLGANRGPSSFGYSTAGGSSRITMADAACLLFDGTDAVFNQPLRSVSASQLESLEIYPPNTETTRTACSRFPVQSACNCGTEFTTAPIFVLWTKR